MLLLSGNENYYLILFEMKIGNQQQKKKDKLPIDRMCKDGIGLYIYRTTKTTWLILAVIAHMNVFCYKLMCLCEREYVISEYVFFFTYISTYMSQITILLQEPLIPNYTVHSSPSNTQNRIQIHYQSFN